MNNQTVITHISAPPSDEIYEPTAATPSAAPVAQALKHPRRDLAGDLRRSRGFSQEAAPQLQISAPPPDEIYHPGVAAPVVQAQRYARPYTDEAAPTMDAPVTTPPTNGSSAPISGNGAAPAPVLRVIEPAALPIDLKVLDYTDDIGGDIDPEQVDENLTPQVTLDVQEMYQIIREVALSDSGDELYSAVSADAEFMTPDYPAYQRRHFGLAFGFLKFTQASKHLGSLLNIMQRREPVLFSEIFGAHSAELLMTLNAATPEERLRPVGGEVLWSPTWIERFRRAGEIPAFQAAQNEEAIEQIFRPMLPVAYELGFVTDRGLAMVFDRVVTRGLGGGLRWVVGTVGPLRTALQRSIALEALGFESVAQFQAAAGWPPQHGRFSPETHAAMVGELRRQGLVPLPTTQELITRLLLAADGAAAIRLKRLHESTQFEDVIYGIEPQG